MKKILILGLLLVLSSISLAQKVSYPALVQRALANGRGNQGKGYYMFRSQGNVVPHDEFRDYMLRNRYYLVQGSNWSVGSQMRFGGTVKTVLSADFLPESEIGYYLAGIKTSDVKKGKAYLLLNSVAIDVEWDGQVSNGFIEGYGYGVVSLGNRQYYLFTGKFHNGIANGNFTLTLATANYRDSDGVFFPAETKKTTKTSYFVSDFVDGYAQFSQNNNWGLINQHGRTIVDAKYKEIVSSFGSDDCAIVLNHKNEEIKVDKSGIERGYSDRQQKIYDDEAARKAEEKRLAERKYDESKKYESAKYYYDGFNFSDFASTYKEYMKEYASDGIHRSEMEEMNRNIPNIMKRIAEGQDFNKWHIGDQVCVLSTSGTGVLFGIVERFSEDRSAVQVKIVYGWSGDYNGQTLKKDGFVWAQQNKGWHLALKEEYNYARSHNKLNTDCDCCAGKGYTICTTCAGKGYINGNYCYSCDQHSGNRICRCCDGDGVVR